MSIIKEKLGIYVHIPFCLSKCKYCGFYSHGGADGRRQKEYVESLIDDIKEYAIEYGDEYIVDTIFIGGGTPSILDEALIGDVMKALREGFDISSSAEITIESNPKTLTKEKLLAYKDFGINRLSIGLQSMDDEILGTLGRAHKAKDFTENYNLARKCGFHNINVDLMFGLPGQTMDVWEDTLEKVIKLDPEHVSFYSLQIEEGTEFYEMYKNGDLNIASDELDRRMYHFAISKLKEAGYSHYEISNSAKSDFECKHNLKYWNMEEYLGIGSNASSFMKGFRFKEAPEPEFYENDLDDNASEFVFTGLRKKEGISLSEFSLKYGVDFWEHFNDRGEIDNYIREGLLIKENGRLFLSEEGIDVSNDIMAEFV